MSPKAPVIMIIRHGEKPVPDQADGINAAGKPGDKSLIVRGWQRAGALVRFFAPLAGEPAGGRLQRPSHVFACGPHAPGSSPEDSSKREEETVTPLSELLGISLDLHYGVDQEKEVAAAALGQNGPVLICWEHKRIPKLAKFIAPDATTPAEWPRERFDMVFCFRLNQDGSTYSFEQVPQLLLPGDSAEPVPL